MSTAYKVTAIAILLFAGLVPWASAEDANESEQQSTEERSYDLPADSSGPPRQRWKYPWADEEQHEEELKPALSMYAVTSGQSRIQHRLADIFMGSVTTEDDQVSSLSQYCSGLFSCSPAVGYDDTARFRDSFVIGVRFKRWREAHPSIALAADISLLRADAPGVSIWYLPISFVPLGRLSLFRTDAVPDGRLQIYTGPMLSFVLGDIDVNGAGGLAPTFGYGGLLGIEWNFGSLGLLAEYRIFRTSLHYTESDSSSFSFDPGTEKASADLRSGQTLIGVSFKY